MTNDPLANVTSVLSGAISDPGDAGALPAGRDEAIAKLAAALGARAQARKRRRAMATMTIAAAMLALVGAGFAGMRHEPAVGSSELGRVSEPAGALTVVRDGHPASLGASGEVAEGSELRTPPQAEARLEFASGTRVTIGGGTHVRLVEQSKKKRFALAAGSFSAKVAKLGPDERFVVATSDAEVEVHGTEFRVSVVEPDPRCGDGTPTRLEVTEGVVAIRHAGVETLVSAGGSWPRCESARVPTAATKNESAVEAKNASASASVPSSPRAAAVNPSAAPTVPASGSQLAQQNALYSRAIRERRENRPEAAVATLDELIAIYPQGPLGESARVERMRALATMDRARATSAARDYLRQYPSGFGRAEAEALVTGP